MTRDDRGDGGKAVQLALTLPHEERLTRDDFLEGASNAAALALADRWPDWPGHTVMVVGPEGSGKTHLAAIFAARAGGQRIAARDLATAEVPALLSARALVIEDLTPGGVDERALFHLLNLAREQGAYLWFTSHEAPAQWTLELPDLASRLRAIPAVHLKPPDDQLLRGLIVKMCSDRQMQVDETLVNFLLSRIERSFSAAREAVALLDTEALRRRRPVTRALAAEVLRDHMP